MASSVRLFEGVIFFENIVTGIGSKVGKLMFVKSVFDIDGPSSSLGVSSLAGFCLRKSESVQSSTTVKLSRSLPKNDMLLLLRMRDALLGRSPSVLESILGGAAFVRLARFGVSSIFFGGE